MITLRVTPLLESFEESHPLDIKSVDMDILSNKKSPYDYGLVSRLDILKNMQHKEGRYWFEAGRC